MKIDGTKNAFKSGAFHGCITVVYAIVYTYVVIFINCGETFVGKANTYGELNGISYDAVLTLCGIMASFIPLIICSFDDAFYLLEYIPTYVISYIVAGFITICIEPFDSNFDLICNLIGPVPAGVVIGLTVKMLYVIIRNKYNKKKGDK